MKFSAPFYQYQKPKFRGCQISIVPDCTCFINNKSHMQNRHNSGATFVLPNFQWLLRTWLGRILGLFNCTSFQSWPHQWEHSENSDQAPSSRRRCVRFPDSLPESSQFRGLWRRGHRMCEKDNDASCEMPSRRNVFVLCHPHQASRTPKRWCADASTSSSWTLFIARSRVETCLVEWSRGECCLVGRSNF